MTEITTNAKPASGVQPNATRRIRVASILPLPCGCEYEVEAMGDLPITMSGGEILIDPHVLHEFMQTAGTALTVAYGELLMNGNDHHGPSIDPPAQTGPAVVVAPSTDTPQ